jgi:hypothetical protein
MMKRTLGGAFVIVFALGARACSHPCETGASRCEGKSLRTCGRACEDCDIDWSRPADCAGACITEDEQNAFCSLTETPDPLCAGRSGYCAADLRVRCRAGYPVLEDRCELSGLPGKAECVETSAGLACRASGPASDAGASDGKADGPGAAR